MSGEEDAAAAATASAKERKKEKEEGEEGEEGKPTDDAPLTPTTTTTTSAVESNFTEQFEKMLTRYGEDYMRRVIEVAKKDTFTVDIMKPTGKKIQDPLEPDKEIEEFDGFETKNFKRKPISSRDYHRAEKLRAQFQNEKDPDKVADNQARIYQFLSFCYLGMSPDEFNRVADWTQIKLVIDACNHRTLYQPSGGNNESVGIR